MNHNRPARSTADRARMAVLTVLAVVALPTGFLVWQATSSAPVSSPDSAMQALEAPPMVTDPALHKLDPDLAEALARATAAARDDGVEIDVTSGWRSPEHQERLLRAAVVRYGSLAEASRWVATPETSPHVSGDAVDIGPMTATDWLAQRGAAYGLCQIYANESWHYELRPDAVTDGCPAMYADPTQDPRMRQ